MEKTGTLVALALTLCACGSVDGALDGGPVLDAGGQCEGVAELAPCDDGQAHTTDACIGGECVGRTCSSVDTRCNTTRLTLDGCEGVPANAGESCNDQDPFTTNDECVGGACTGDPCPCPPGEPCCNDACGFRGVETICEWSAVVTCTAPCGGTATMITSFRRCDGATPGCTAALAEDMEAASCAPTFACEAGAPASPEDERFGCLASAACD